MHDLKFYEQRVRDMLAIAELRVKASYTPAEVKQLLGVRGYAFRRMCSEWEPPGVAGRKKAGIESYVIHSHRRIPFHGLVNWLAENYTYERERALESGG